MWCYQNLKAKAVRQNLEPWHEVPSWSWSHRDVVLTTGDDARGRAREKKFLGFSSPTAESRKKQWSQGIHLRKARVAGFEVLCNSIPVLWYTSIFTEWVLVPCFQGDLTIRVCTKCFRSPVDRAAKLAAGVQEGLSEVPEVRGSLPGGKEEPVYTGGTSVSEIKRWGKTGS